MSKPKAFDYWKSIQDRKYMEDISGFSRHVMDMLLSSDPDFIFLVDNLNKLGTHKLSPRAIYDYYYYTIPKNNLYLKYPKKDKEDKSIKYIMKYFGVNDSIARQYMTLLPEEKINTIISLYEDYGV